MYQEIQPTLRVKFTLTKFKEENLEPRVGDKLLLLTKLLQQGSYKLWNLEIKQARQIDTPRPLQKISKIK